MWVLVGHSEDCGFFTEMRARRKPGEGCEQRRAMPDSGCNRIPLAAVNSVRVEGARRRPQQ